MLIVCKVLAGRDLPIFAQLTDINNLQLKIECWYANKFDSEVEVAFSTSAGYTFAKIRAMNYKVQGE